MTVTTMRERKAGAVSSPWIAALIFLPPALLLFTVFVILPIGEAAWYSFYNWDGFNRPQNFVWFRNYVSLFNNASFRTAALNNLIIIAVSLGVQLPLALGMALLLSKRAFGAVAFRLIFFLPYILADVAAGLIFRFIFDGDYGPLSGTSDALGFGQIYMLASPSWAMVAILIVIIWKYFGFHMMLFIAGLQGIDRNLYEAAEIDGAGAFQRFRFVTIPQLSPMIKLSVFFSVIGALQLFDVVIPLTGGGPFNATNTMVTFLYLFGITRMRVGFGSAVGVVLFIVCVTFALGYRRLLMRDD
jgi:raffinose/stachyose/melibiose transport system permease protein